MASAGAGETLWLDELHTSWTVAGTWDQIPERAAAGNQSSGYFYLLWPLVSTLGHSEWVFRLLSLLSLALCAGLIHWRLSSLENGRPLMAAACVLAFVSVERIQLFYATEARVYGLCQWLGLLAWVLVFQATRAKPVGNTHRSLAAWCALSVLATYLHIVALIPLACQAAWLACRAAKCSRREMASRLAWLLGCLVAVLPACWLAQPVWQRRAQWSSFAGDASIDALVHLFPILPWLIPALSVFAVHEFVFWWRSGKLQIEQSVAAESSTLATQTIGWWWAALAPLGIVWCVTAWDIAPMMHRRYVLGAALPLVMAASLLVLQLKDRRLQVLVLLVTFGWLTASQGTLQRWSQGRFIGWQRGEGWKSAAAWVSQRIGSDDRLWCASGLIEARGLTLPLDKQQEAYLSLPLRSVYAVERGGPPERVEPNAIFGDSQLWLERLLEEPDRRHWLVYRGTAQQLQGRLQRLSKAAAMRGPRVDEDTPAVRFTAPVEFGRVSVTSVRIE